MTPPGLQSTEKKTNTNLGNTVHAVHNAGGANKTPPRENQKVAKGEPPGSPFAIYTVRDFRLARIIPSSIHVSRRLVKMD
jgi:hypothetical protein